MKNSSGKLLVLFQISVCVFGSGLAKGAALPAEIDPVLDEILVETQDEKKARCKKVFDDTYDECCRNAPGGHCVDGTRDEQTCDQRSRRAEKDFLSAPSPQSPPALKSVALNSGTGSAESPKGSG